MSRALQPPATNAAPYPMAAMLFLVLLFVPVQVQVAGLLLSPLRVFLLGAIPVLSVRLITGRAGRLSVVDALIVVYLAWSALALWVNSPSRAVENAGITTVEFLGGYLIARTCIRSASDFMAVCGLFTGLLVITAPLAVVEALTSTAPLLWLGDALPGVKSDTDFVFIRNGIDRAQLAFPHPILYGLVASAGVSLAVFGLPRQIGPVARALRVAVIILATALSVSSGAVLALALQLGLMGWAWITPGLRSRWMWLVAAGLGGYLALDLIANRTPLRILLSHATFVPQTAFTRVAIFHWGMVNVQAHPWLGLGLNDWVRPATMNYSLDNFWLLTAMRYGVPAFVCLALAWVWAIVRVGRVGLADPLLIGLRRGWAFALIGVAFCLVTVHVWAAAYSFVAFLLGAGLWMLDAAEADADPLAHSGHPRVRRAPAPVYARDFG